MIFRLKDYRNTTNFLNNQNYVLSHSLKKSLKIQFLLKSDKFLLVWTIFRLNVLISKVLKKVYTKTVFISFSFFSLIIALLIYLFIYNLLTLFLYFLFINYIWFKVLNILEDFKKVNLKIIWFKKRRVLRNIISLYGYDKDIYINNLIIDYKVWDILSNNWINRSKLYILTISSILSLLLLILMYV